MTINPKDTLDQTPQREEKKRNDSKSDGMDEKKRDGGDGKASFFDGSTRQPASHEQNQNAENWVELCARAAIEQDPKKLLELVSEINRLLDVRKNRLSQKEDDGKR
jgi:hypothetical protein